MSFHLEKEVHFMLGYADSRLAEVRNKYFGSMSSRFGSEWDRVDN